MTVLDIAGYVTDLKMHASEHGFHVHDERHFVETYTLRQNWEVDIHPESGCGAPLDIHLSLEVEARNLLSFEDEVKRLEPDGEPKDSFHIPLFFMWEVPPLDTPPDLLVLATDLAGIGGTDLPIEISAIDSFAAVSDAPERRLSIVAKVEVSLLHLFRGERDLCGVLDACHQVSEYLLDRVDGWLGDQPEV